MMQSRPLELKGPFVEPVRPPTRASGHNETPRRIAAHEDVLSPAAHEIDLAALMISGQGTLTPVLVPPKKKTQRLFGLVSDLERADAAFKKPSLAHDDLAHANLDKRPITLVKLSLVTDTPSTKKERQQAASMAANLYAQAFADNLLYIRDVEPEKLALLEDAELDQLLDVLLTRNHRAHWLKERPALFCKKRTWTLFATAWQEYLQRFVWRRGAEINGATALTLHLLDCNQRALAERLIIRRPTEIAYDLGTSVPQLCTLTLMSQAFVAALPAIMNPNDFLSLSCDERLNALCVMMQSYLQRHCDTDVKKLQAHTAAMLRSMQCSGFKEEPAYLGLLVGTAFSAAQRYAKDDVYEVHKRWSKYAYNGVIILFSLTGILNFIEELGQYPNVIAVATTIIGVIIASSLEVTDHSNQLIKSRGKLIIGLSNDPSFVQRFDAPRRAEFYDKMQTALTACGIV